MRTFRIVALFTLLGTFTALTARAQTTWWRIVSGPGVGAVLRGSNTKGGVFINDFANDANGFIAGSAPDCRCLFADGHYHGTLHGVSDPRPNTCGWGCVLQMPCSGTEARNWLRQEIDDSGSAYGDLANKLDKILDAMIAAKSNGCYTVFKALAGAFCDEIRGYFGPSLPPELFDAMFEYLDSYVNLSDYEWDLGYMRVPHTRLGTVNILGRSGSGNYSNLRLVAPKISVGLGHVVSLEGFGTNIQSYGWSYKFKGMPTGEIPSGCGISFIDNHITFSSLKPTQLQITLRGMTSTNRRVRDKLLVNFSRQVD
jgi:hypothetical protein